MGIQDHKVRSFVQNNKKDEIFFLVRLDIYLVGMEGKGRRGEEQRQRPWAGSWKLPLWEGDFEKETEKSEK